MDAAFHVAQINVARASAPIDSAQLAEFIGALEPVNALAESSPGFVWRLQDDSGDAVSIRVFDDDQIIVNMSVWETIETLFEFAYRSDHVEYFRRRREWFTRYPTTHFALWWVRPGHVPTIDDAKDRLERLEANGPTPYAFTFKQRFATPADGERAAPTASGAADGSGDSR
jgi:hypothetical protein